MHEGSRNRARREDTPASGRPAPDDRDTLVERFRAEAFLRAPEAILVTRLSDGHILDANLAFTTMTGFTRAEAIGRTTVELGLYAHTGDRETLLADIRSQGCVLHRAFPLRLKDGSQHTGIVSFSPLTVGDESCLVSTLYSVTEQDVAGEALVRSEARYRRLFEAAGDAIFILRDDRFVDCNRRALEMFGCAREAILGHPPYEFSPPTQPDGGDSRTAALEYVRAALGGTPQQFEWTHRRADGIDFPAEVSLVTLDLPTGPHLQAIVRDITERRRAEAALLESEANMRQIVENAPFGAHVYELRPDGRLVFVGANAEADRILGADHRRFVGLTIEEAFPPLAETGIPAAYRDVAATGARFDTHQLAYDQGRIRGVYDVHAFQTGPGRMAAFFLDITERHRAELALSRSEEQYRLLAENVADVIWTMDLGMRLTYVSPSIQKMHGGMPEDWIGRGLADIVVPDALGPLSATIARELREQGRPGSDPHRVVTIEVEQLRQDGSRFWTEVTARLMRDRTGAPSGIIGVTRDIRERQRAESERRTLEEQLMQAQKMESVGRLAGGVAHDFNNMLTPILGHAELLRNELPPGDPRRPRVLEMLSAAERCRDLVQRLLAFARKQTFALRPVDMSDVVRGFERMLRRTLREDVRLELRLAPALGPIAADRGQLEQILMNLAVNAQDAMPDGGTLTIETADEAGAPPAGREVRLEVRDTGTGMDDATRARVFEPFFTTKGPGHGTGLGLSTVFGIVEQHRGTIEVASAPGQGTTFRMRFPCVAPDATPDAPARPADPGRPVGGTVLVVEDEAQVRALAVEVLRGAGHVVLAAADAHAALALARAHAGTIDLLLTDVVLPDENGRVLHARLTAERPGMRALYMSGYTADVIGHRGVLDPGVDFIQKPFSVGALTTRVAEVLART